MQYESGPPPAVGWPDPPLHCTAQDVCGGVYEQISNGRHEVLRNMMLIRQDANGEGSTVGRMAATQTGTKTTRQHVAVAATPPTVPRWIAHLSCVEPIRQLQPVRSDPRSASSTTGPH